MKSDATADEHAQLAEGIQTLKSIDVIQTFHLGTPAGTVRDVIDRSYDFSLMLIFADAGDELIYQHHPAHLKFVDDCKHLWKKVLIYDSVDG